MYRVDHSFDWSGLFFYLKSIAILSTLALVGYSGLLLLTRDMQTASSAQTQSVSAQQLIAATSLSSTTPEHIINSLTIADTVPKDGKFVAVDLVHMKLYLYQDGSVMNTFDIITKGRPGTPWETPSGFYEIKSKERTHFSTIGHVYMPYSMQFYGNYFIHGWTYYPDGTPVSASFSGGCIKLSTDDAKSVFAFADVGTKVFVYDSKQTTPPQALLLGALPVPNSDAASYLVADIDTGDVYAERNSDMVRPIASVTKLMTALVANEIISLDKEVSVEEGELANPQNISSTTQKTFLVNDLFYPLLMQSSNAIANSLAAYYGTRGFVEWMNTTARALDMASTTYADPSGISPSNTSTPEDLFRMATYLSNKKSFVFSITHTESKTIIATDGTRYAISNVNAPANTSPFDGGKVGHTSAAQDTMVSTLSFSVGSTTRRIAIIVLGSSNQEQDTNNFAQWITHAAVEQSTQAACVLCAQPPQYRKIRL